MRAGGKISENFLLAKISMYMVHTQMCTFTLTCPCVHVSINPATNFRLTLAIMNPLLGRDNTNNFGKEFKCMMTTFLHALDN